MKSLGGLMFFFGIGSMVLHFMEREFIVLAWVDMWGPQIGWAIRIGLAIVGGLMWLIGNKNES
jgi:hypothetical protein